MLAKSFHFTAHSKYTFPFYSDNSDKKFLLVCSSAVVKISCRSVCVNVVYIPNGHGARMADRCNCEVFSCT